MKKLFKNFMGWYTFHQEKRRVKTLLPKVLEDFYQLRDIVNAPGFDLEERIYGIRDQFLLHGVCYLLVYKYKVHMRFSSKIIFNLSKKIVDKLYPENTYNSFRKTWTSTLYTGLHDVEGYKEGLNMRIRILEEMVKKYC